MIDSWFEPTDSSLFFSKQDQADPRLGDWVKPTKTSALLPAGAFVMVGYPDDEGIKLNGGRPGAAMAPEGIRKALYKMTPSLRHAVPLPLPLFDGGNILIEGSLSERHERARKTVHHLLNQQAQVITIGGGHDYGFSDMAAFCAHTINSGQRPFVINFDAHLDVRPDTQGENSGTPFYRLLNQYAGQMDFFEVGIQDWCNSRAHLTWALERGANVITLEELHLEAGNLSEAFSKQVLRHVTPKHRLAISVDIDCFSSSSCPGASQVFPTGFMANEFLKMWQPLVSRHRPQVTSFYEVSPPFDLDQRTCRMAALLIHQRLFAN